MVESDFSPRPKTPGQSDDGATTGANVTLRPGVEGYFACPTCKRLRPVELAKTNKPYFKCNDCGVQVFFRGKDGIRRLREMLGRTSPSGSVAEILPLLEYAASLRNRLREIRKEKPILGEDRGLEIEEKVIWKERARVEKILEIELKEKRRQLHDFKRIAGIKSDAGGTPKDVL